MSEDIVKRLREFDDDSVVVLAMVNEAADEIERLRADLRRSQASEERAWRERNLAVTKVRGWEATVVAEGLPIRAAKVEEWGPGEGETVGIPTVTPRKLTEILDELAELRAKVAA